MPVRKIALLPALAALLVFPAQAQELTAPSWPVGSAVLRLDAEAGGALFGPQGACVRTPGGFLGSGAAL